MKIKALATLFIVLLLVACNSNTEEINYLDPIEVELITNDDLEVNAEINTQAVISQSGNPVSNVSEVIFEIWQHGNKETYITVDGTEVGEGVYEVTWRAEEEGIYYIYYHITAAGMHRMEKIHFIIGDVDEKKILATPDERPNQFMD
ncbi:FixH family protein [Bacillaceae bacterium IKA-2]|nr:FixH family protein [Bacillaceae bacterium IKA-2]